jgi:serine phosphatase RsbU (regulator of sigma subunit)
VKPLFLISTIFFFVICYSQSREDSLINTWKNPDANLQDRISAVDNLIWDYVLFNNPDSAYFLGESQFELAKDGYNKAEKDSLVFKKNIAIAQNNMGNSRYMVGRYDEAIEHYIEYLRIGLEIKNDHIISAAQNNLANIYFDKGDIIKSIDYYNQSLLLAEEIKDSVQIGNAMDNIGVCYVEINEFEKARDYHFKSLAVRQSIQDQSGIAMSFGNLANSYFYEKDYKQAESYNLKSLEVYKTMQDNYGIVNTLTSIAGLYQDMNLPKKSFDYYQKAKKIAEESNNELGMVVILTGLGIHYKIDSNFMKAFNYANQAMELAIKIEATAQIGDIAEVLYQCNKHFGKPAEALKMFELFISTRDSLNSEQTQKEIFRQEYKISYQRKAIKDSVKNEQEKKLAEAEFKSEKEKKELQLIYALVLIVIIFIAAILVYRRFRVTQKQKGIIEEQKDQVDQAFDELEEKNQEIMDSISYAKRIQSAILPPRKIVKEYLDQSFILYKPKDIVAGDFYWMESVSAESRSSSGGEMSEMKSQTTKPVSASKTGHLDSTRCPTILLAAADCTGHGVPGAMVSVVCNNGLNRSVREHGLSDPGRILDKTREIVIQEFEKSEDDVKDGMDIALVSLEFGHFDKCDDQKKENTELVEVPAVMLRYAGAHNPLWIIRNGATELEEIKADKQPIGKFSLAKPFTTHLVELNKGDTIYIFSDGYSDQFGGEKGKKLKSGNFKKLLLSMQSESMEQQQESLDQYFENWRGEHEQIDDVCVIGFRV